MWLCSQLAFVLVVQPFYIRSQVERDKKEFQDRLDTRDTHVVGIPPQLHLDLEDNQRAEVLERIAAVLVLQRKKNITLEI